ncbi:MAG: DUF1343 domain-containing protein, partial [Candidatus Wallbacteria bacterium]|nr:DUF1343 domain-containing protein [Candidatus Wallbacteria bacterium]
RSSADVLHEKADLKALFAAEHGIRGAEQAGDLVDSAADPVTGAPVFSLYGSTKKPTLEMLDKIDVLCYDMQDVGARFYTYIYTMAYCMEACAEAGKTFVVFDRPNPISGKIEGIPLDPAFKSFIGNYPIVQRYGLTPGELAGFINKEFGIGCRLEVVPLQGWSRDMYYEDTGLGTWVMPSPNMPTVDTAVVYTGTCVFEGTNLSEGRGTTRPFELIGSPWINGQKLAEKLNSLELPGVKFRPAGFKPYFSKHSGETCSGVQVHVTDRQAFSAVKTGFAMLYTVRDMFPEKFQYLESNFIDKLAGGSYIREGKYTIDQLFDMIDRESEKFGAMVEPYLLY